MNYVDPSICDWSPTTFLFFSDNVWGNFVYYAHLLPSLSGLIIGGILLYNNRNNTAVRWLFAMTIVFAIWCLVDLVLWSSDRSDIIVFGWSSLIYFELLVYVTAGYFFYSFINGHNPSYKIDILVFVLFVPLFLFGHTSLNLSAFDFTNCWREAIEGPLWSMYIYYIEILIVLVIVIYGFLRFFDQSITKKKSELIIITVALVLFLSAFSLGNILGSLGVDWELGQIGLYGMPLFAALIAYDIVKYRTFGTKLIAAEVLIVAMIIFISSLLFIRRIEDIQIVAVFTLIVTIIMGYLLVRSVRQEIKQREEIEKLAANLKRANDRLRELDKMKSEFVSIASHQLRSPITSIRGFASMMAEGSFGKLPPKAQEATEHIAEASKNMALSVEDYLNVSRIESGNMTYDFVDFNLRDEAERVVDDLRITAIKNGLLLTFKSDLTKQGIVNADKGKTIQILHNLCNNAIKYTPKGSITVHVHNNAATNEIYVDVSDTGIGMSEATINSIFAKFSRAQNAHKINVHGTGLGLYIAKLMANAMHGDITASSPGEGQGSTFRLTLPLVM